MNLNWREHKRRVESLAAQAEEASRRERRSRAHLAGELRVRATRGETLLWAGVIGFVFFYRRRHEDAEARRSFPVEIGLAAWAVQRWRTLPRRVEASIDRAREQLRASDRARAAAAQARAGGAAE